MYVNKDTILIQVQVLIELQLLTEWNGVEETWNFQSTLAGWDLDVVKEAMEVARSSTRENRTVWRGERQWLETVYHGERKAGRSVLTTNVRRDKQKAQTVGEYENESREQQMKIISKGKEEEEI